MRLHPVLLFLMLALSPAWAQSPPSTNAAPIAPRALPVDPASVTTSDMAVPGGVNIHWYGHGFVFLTSSVGIRAAIDPFGPETVQYTFPPHLTADFVLISHEAEDHSAAELVFGNPLIFRSVMAVGLQRANGIPFHGIALQKDAAGQGGSNTAFTLTFDGITFGYLGQINLPLLNTEKRQLGQIDVLFLPVGLNTLSVAELNQVAQDVRAKIIIPINYKTEKSGSLDLRSLDDYLGATKFPVRHIQGSEFVLTKSMIPQDPTVFVLTSP